VNFKGYLFIADESLRYVSALPGGNRHSNGNFNNVGSHGNWWSSSHGGNNAWNRNMSSGSGSVGENQNDKSNGYSVLCVRDCDGEKLRNQLLLLYN